MEEIILKLKEYIKNVMQSTEAFEVYFEVNLTSDGYVVSSETGNKVSFTLLRNEVEL